MRGRVGQDSVGEFPFQRYLYEPPGLSRWLQREERGKREGGDT